MLTLLNQESTATRNLLPDGFLEFTLTPRKTKNLPTLVSDIKK